MRRREVLQLGSVAAVGALLPLSIATMRSVELIYDRRYAPARMLAGASRATAHALPADPVLLWQGIGTASRIAGLTNYADMMMFADLARTSGRRMAIRTAHHLDGACAAHVAHQGLSTIAPLVAAGVHWPIALLSIFGGSPAAIAVERDARRGTLWSWMIDR